jgi:hypothetical protein
MSTSSTRSRGFTSSRERPADAIEVRRGCAPRCGRRRCPASPWASRPVPAIAGGSPETGCRFLAAARLMVEARASQTDHRAPLCAVHSPLASLGHAG